MTLPYTGGCACGAVRYETTLAPVFQNTASAATANGAAAPDTARG